MKQVMAITILLGASISAGADILARVPQKSCDSTTARIAEGRLDEISTWEQFADFYGKYGRCDMPALSYGFTDRIAELASNSANMVGLQREIRRNHKLKRVVLRHLSSDAISSDQAEKINDAVRFGCPSESRRLCEEIRSALSPAKP